MPQASDGNGMVGEFVKTASLFAGAKIITTVVSLIRNKYIAVLLGPTATGIYSVIASFLQILTIASTLNLGVSAAKYTSQYYSEKRFDHLRYTFRFCVKFVAVSSLAIFLLILLLSRQITFFLFGDYEYYWYVILVSATILFSASSIYSGALQGLLERSEIAKVQVIAAVLGLASMAVLVYVLSLTGYFISLLLAAIYTFVLFYFSIKKVPVLQTPSYGYAGSTAGDVRKKLFEFSGANFILMITHPLSFFVVRYSILEYMGVEGVGFYAACLSIPTLVLGLFQVNLYYYFPRMNAVMPEGERVRSINEFFRFSLLTLTPLMIVVILLPDLVVNVLLDAKFQTIVEYLPLFVLAEFVGNLAGIFSSPVVGLTKLGFHVLWTLFYQILWIIGSILFLKAAGLKGVGIATILSHAVRGVGYYMYLNRLIPLRMEKRNLRLFIIVAGGILICMFVPSLVTAWELRIAIYFLVLVAVCFLFNSKERVEIGRIVMKTLTLFCSKKKVSGD